MVAKQMHENNLKTRIESAYAARQNISTCIVNIVVIVEFQLSSLLTAACLSQYRQQWDEISAKTQRNGLKSLPEKQNNPNNSMQSLEMQIATFRLLTASLHQAMGSAVHVLPFVSRRVSDWWNSIPIVPVSFGFPNSLTSLRYYIMVEAKTETPES